MVARTMLKKSVSTIRTICHKKMNVDISRPDKHMNNEEQSKGESYAHVKRQLALDIKKIKQYDWSNYYKKYLSITKQKVPMYWADSSSAKQFVDCIWSHLSRNMSYVIEVNPGIGVLTRELLANNIPLFYLYERDNVFYEQLTNLKKQYPERLQIHEEDFFKMIYVSNKCPDVFYDKVEKLLSRIPQRNWHEDTCIQVITTMNDMKHIKILIWEVIQTRCMALNGRPGFYLALLPSMWHMLTRRQIGIRFLIYAAAFQTFFNFEWLGSLNRNAFVPLQPINVGLHPYTALKKDDHKSMYIVYIEPKRDLPTEFKDPINRKRYLHFLRFYGHKNKRIIPELELWVPGCGPRLIASNINIFTQFNDLEVLEILDIYLKFISWPETKRDNFYDLFDSIISGHVDQKSFDEVNDHTALLDIEIETLTKF